MKYRYIDTLLFLLDPGKIPRKTPCIKVKWYCPFFLSTTYTSCCASTEKCFKKL